MEGVLPVPLALQLRDAGLRWKPAPGDRFAIPDRDLDDEVFVLSNMVIAVYELPDGPVIGFNGTTEWAMDDVEQSEAIWLPREDQLRDLLGGTFQMLEHTGTGFRAVLSVGDRRHAFEAVSAEEAYGAALLELIRWGVD
jgi:hypothetical protein